MTVQPEITTPMMMIAVVKKLMEMPTKALMFHILHKHRTVVLFAK